MARPTKAIVDYFPHDANQGKTLFILEQQFGDKGYCFWFKLLEMFATSENHYIDTRNDDTWEFLTAKTRTDDSLCRQILDKLAKLDAIDKDLWEKEIVFSQNFVKRISDAYRNRKINLWSKSDILRNLFSEFQNSEVSDVRNSQESIVSDVINPQSKVKEIKVNNIPPISPEKKINGGGQIISQEIPKKNPDDFLTIPCDQIQKKYNDLCKKLTPLQCLTNSRRGLVIDRWRENPQMEFWEGIFIKANEVCLSNGWKPDFDWLFSNDTNYIKILEGKFNKSGGTNGESWRNSEIKQGGGLYDLSQYKVN